MDYAVTGVPSAGTYYVKLRYYSSSAPVVAVQVNGGSSQTVNLANAGSWNIGGTEQTITVALSAGSNNIRIQGTGGGSCKQDRICVNSDPNGRIGAEEIPLAGSRITHQPSDADRIVVTPNPNSGSFEVRFYLEKGTKATLSVIDVQGKSWYEHTLTGTGSHKERISLANSVSGTFRVLLRKENGVEVKKVVVVK